MPWAIHFAGWRRMNWVDAWTDRGICSGGFCRSEIRVEERQDAQSLGIIADDVDDSDLQARDAAGVVDDADGKPGKIP